MDFPVYVVGDGYVFYNVLNAIAMVFSSAGFWNSVFLLAGLSTLIGVLFKMVPVAGGESAHSGAFGVSAPLYFAAIVALIGIRSNVIVQDIYSGQVYKVSNIPIVIGAPASMFTTASYKVFLWVDTAYSLPNATTSLSVGSVGFLNPIKMLLALRSGIEGGVDPYARKTLDEYITYCGESSTLDAKQVATVSNIALLKYLQTNAFQGGLTNVYNEANPDGLVGTCRQAADYLVNYFKSQVADPNNSPYLANILNLRMKEKNPSDITGKGSWTGLSGAQTILNIGGAAAQSAQDFAINALTFNTITLAFDCRHKRVFESAYSSCVADLAKASTQEQWKTAETFAASFFMSTAILTQTMMQLMFFALSPIILIFMLFAGASGFKTYWNFIVFGIWTSTFLVFTAVIQGVILLGLQARANSWMGTGLTLQSWSDMYSGLTFWLAAGSSLMAAVPLLAYGLLKGTGSAYTAISSRMNGDSHAKVDAVSPDMMKHGPMFSTQPVGQFNGASGISKSGAATDIKVATSNQVSRVDSQALQNSISQSWGKNWQAGRTETDSSGTKFTSTTDGIEYAKQDGSRGVLTKQEAAKIAASGGLKVMGNGVGVDVSTGRQYNQEQTKAFDMSQRLGWSTGAEAGHSTSLTGSLTESEQRAIANQMTTATQKARTQTSTVSQTYDINALKGIRDANPKAYDTKINNQAMDMARGPDGLAFDKAMQQATQDLNGYQMDPASKDALIKTVALANTQTGGVDVTGLVRPDASGVNQQTPNINPGTSLSAGAQTAAKGRVETESKNLQNQSASDRKNLEPASGAMLAQATGDAGRSTISTVGNVMKGAVGGDPNIKSSNQWGSDGSPFTDPNPALSQQPPKSHKLLDATKVPNERGGAPSANAGHNTQASPALPSGAQPAQDGTKPTEKK